MMERWTDLRDTGVGSVETGFDTLRRLIGEFEGGLEHVDGKLGMDLCGNPASEVDMYRFSRLNL